MRNIPSRPTRLSFLLFVIGAQIILSSANLPSKAQNAATENALEPDSKMALVYLRPGTDLKKFKTVHAQALIVPLDARDTAPKSTAPDAGESYLLRDKDVADIQALYQSALREVLTGAGYKLVDTPQSDTLIVATKVEDITLKAPLENVRGPGRVRTFSQGGGSITIEAEFADGGTGEVIARIKDKKYVTDVWQANTRIQNIPDLHRTFSEWAGALANRLTNG
jgi:hypothetical protein